MRKLLYALPAIGLFLLILTNGCKHECKEVDLNPGDTTICDTSNVTYNGTVVPILSVNCYGCHSGATPQGGLDLTDYDQLAFVAQNGALLGSIKHEAGFSPMPKDAEKLSDCDISKIEKWVNDTTFTTEPEPHPCDPDTVYFEMQLLPVLQSACAQPGCHDVTATEGIRLDSYEAVMASDIVIPYDPSESEMYEKIIETDPEKVMPPPPANPLSQDQIDLVYKWIEQGAQNLFCDEMCDTVNISFNETIWQETIEAYCFGCHNGANASGGIHLENYDDVKTAAQIPVGQYGSLMGTITHSFWNSPMPKNQAKLSDCKITQITKWIENGMPNN